MSAPPRKRFGQHFLHDPNVIGRIVALIDPGEDDAMVEIGPGQGALTALLLEQVRHLHVIEIDRDLIAELERQPYAGRLTIHSGDVLAFDFMNLPERLRVVGNLPYNISTPILFHLLGFATRIVDLHFMLQKEVVDRMVAAPSTPQYGRLSVMLQARFEMRKCLDVGAGAFKPPPKVASAIVRLVPKGAAIGLHDETTFASVVTAAFTKRRKTLRNALAGWIDVEGLAALGIDAGLRPENLSVENYAAIANRIADRGRRVTLR